MTDQEEKKRLFMNLAGLDMRQIVKGSVIPAPPHQEDGNPSDSYQAFTDAVLTTSRPTVHTTSDLR